MNSIYICYANEDYELALQIVASFKKFNKSCIFVERNYQDTNEDQAIQMLNGIKKADTFLVVFTSNSNISEWVSIQIVKAVSLNKRCILLKEHATKIEDHLKFSLANFEFYSFKDLDIVIEKCEEQK